MQTVGAQWLLVDDPAASTLVALVQTANMTPVFFLALPAGVFADVFDRRRLLIGVQLASLVVAGVLAALTAAGQATPVLLLAFTFLLGCGMTLTMPAWQALIPELVPRSQLPAASALGGISMNLARAVGPAVAGLLIASVDVAAVFALNALSFGLLAVALAAWRRKPAEPDDVPEGFGSALRAGGRYIRHSLVVRRVPDVAAAGPNAEPNPSGTSSGLGAACGARWRGRRPGDRRRARSGEHRGLRRRWRSAVPATAGSTARARFMLIPPSADAARGSGTLGDQRLPGRHGQRHAAEQEGEGQQGRGSGLAGGGRRPGPRRRPAGHLHPNEQANTSPPAGPGRTPASCWPSAPGRPASRRPGRRPAATARPPSASRSRPGCPAGPATARGRF